MDEETGKSNMKIMFLLGHLYIQFFTLGTSFVLGDVYSPALKKE